MFHSVSNRAHGKRSRNSLFRGSVHFRLVFFFFLYDIRVAWFDWFLRIERVTAHRIIINDHSCFHNSWTNSKRKLNYNIFESKGAPWCFRGPTQLAYSAHRADQLWYRWWTERLLKEKTTEEPHEDLADICQLDEAKDRSNCIKNEKNTRFRKSKHKDVLCHGSVKTAFEEE